MSTTPFRVVPVGCCRGDGEIAQIKRGFARRKRREARQQREGSLS